LGEKAEYPIPRCAMAMACTWALARERERERERECVATVVARKFYGGPDKRRSTAQVKFSLLKGKARSPPESQSLRRPRLQREPLREKSRAIVRASCERTTTTYRFLLPPGDANARLARTSKTSCRLDERHEILPSLPFHRLLAASSSRERIVGEQLTDPQTSRFPCNRGFDYVLGDTAIFALMYVVFLRSFAVVRISRGRP